MKEINACLIVHFLCHRGQRLNSCRSELTQRLGAPYSLRPKPGATVSMPRHWEEVNTGLKMKDFTIANAIERLKNKGDIFKHVLGKELI